MVLSSGVTRGGTYVGSSASEHVGFATCVAHREKGIYRGMKSSWSEEKDIDNSTLHPFITSSFEASLQAILPTKFLPKLYLKGLKQSHLALYHHGLYPLQGGIHILIRF